MLRDLLGKNGFCMPQPYGFDFFTYLTPTSCHFSEMRTLGLSGLYIFPSSP